MIEYNKIKNRNVLDVRASLKVGLQMEQGLSLIHIYIGFDDAEEELKRMEEFRKAQAEVEQKKEKTMSQKMFKVV